MYIQYHILGRHVILMLCLNLMLGPTYLPYFFLAANRNHTYISFRPNQGWNSQIACQIANREGPDQTASSFWQTTSVIYTQRQ